MQHYVLQCVDGGLLGRQPRHINVAKAVVSKRRSPCLPAVYANVLVVLNVVPFVLVTNKIAHNIVFVEFAVDYHFAEVKRYLLSTHAVYTQAHHAGVVFSEVVDVPVARRNYAFSGKSPLFPYRLDVALAQFTSGSFGSNRLVATRQRFVRRRKKFDAIQACVVAFPCANVVKRDCRSVYFKRHIRLKYLLAVACQRKCETRRTTERRRLELPYVEVRDIGKAVSQHHAHHIIGVGNQPIRNVVLVVVDGIVVVADIRSQIPFGNLRAVYVQPIQPHAGNAQ